MKWFSREKGWGFIRLESGDEVFVHHSDIEGDGFVTLEDDEPVEFTVEEMEKGPRARNVRRPGQEPAAGGEARREADARRGAPRDQHESPKEDRGRSSDDRGDRQGGRSRDGRSREEESSGGLRPLAAQLRERLGRHFPGLGG